MPGKICESCGQSVPEGMIRCASCGTFNEQAGLRDAAALAAGLERALGTHYRVEELIGQGASHVRARNRLTRSAASAPFRRCGVGSPWLGTPLNYHAGQNDGKVTLFG